MVAWAVWNADDVEVSGDDLRDGYDQGEGTSRRVWCGHCGGAIGNRKPKHGMMVVYASKLDDPFVFEPGMHLHYAARAMDIADGVPKYVDAPAAFGGSDEMIDEPAATAWRRV